MSLGDRFGVHLLLLVLGERAVDARDAGGQSLAFAGGGDQVGLDLLDQLCLRRMLVLAKGSAEPISSTDLQVSDLSGVGDRCGQRAEWGCLIQGSVRPVPVVVQLEFA